MQRPRTRPLSRASWGALAVLLTATAGGVAGCGRPHGEASSGQASALTQEQAKVLLTALAEAPSHGFAPGAFGEQGLEAQLKSQPREGLVRLRTAALAYARAMHGQAIPARAMDTNWDARPKYDAEAAFIAAATAGRLEAWAKALPPASPQYQSLRGGYAAYGRIVAAGGWPTLAADKGLRPGASGPQVTALRARLAVEDKDAAEAGEGGAYDAALTAAVQRAQARYGQDPTGVADADLIAALNVPAQARLAQIAANLERLRWLPREISADRVEANTAAGIVDVYQAGRDVIHMRAAAGKPGDESPILVSRIDRVVLNPTWNVPDQIAENELLPKGEAYLERMGFRQNADGEGARLVQEPGPENALGRVKFLFDNRFSVYLHDTPAKAAFTREQRSVSHGCVRLEKALDLAQLLLTTRAGWSPERMSQTLASGETTEVKLDHPVQVILTYETAFAQADGRMAFRQDVYGWDAEVLRRLAAARPGRA